MVWPLLSLMRPTSQLLLLPPLSSRPPCLSPGPFLLSPVLLVLVARRLLPRGRRTLLGELTASSSHLVRVKHLVKQASWARVYSATTSSTRARATRRARACGRSVWWPRLECWRRRCPRRYSSILLSTWMTSSPAGPARVEPRPRRELWAWRGQCKAEVQERSASDGARGNRPRTYQPGEAGGSDAALAIRAPERSKGAIASALGPPTVAMQRKLRLLDATVGPGEPRGARPVAKA